MSEWTWTNDKLNQPINNYSLLMSVALIFLVMYSIVVILVFLSYGGSINEQFIIFLIFASIVIAIFIALIIYAHSRIKFMRRVATCLKEVKIKGKSVILDTANGTYTAKLNEVNICYGAIMRGVNPIAYNLFIRYQDLVYEIPELRPEDFGALRQFLRGYGMDLNECTDDLSRYVCMGQSQQQW